MADRTTYPDTPGVRAGSPDTAYAAAESVADAAKSREALALKFFQQRGLVGGIADEVAEAFEWDKYSVRPRLSTLRANGKIVDSGDRRRGTSGRWQAVWIASEFAPVPDSIAQGVAHG